MFIQLVSRADCKNRADSLFKNLSIGTLWDSVVGILGGGTDEGINLTRSMGDFVCGAVVLRDSRLIKKRHMLYVFFSDQISKYCLFQSYFFSYKCRVRIDIDKVKPVRNIV